MSRFRGRKVWLDRQLLIKLKKEESGRSSKDQVPMRTSPELLKHAEIKSLTVSNLARDAKCNKKGS